MEFSHFTLYLGDKIFQFKLDNYSSIDLMSGLFSNLEPVDNVCLLSNCLLSRNSILFPFIEFDIDGKDQRLFGVGSDFKISKIRLSGQSLIVDGYIQDCILLDQKKVYSF